MGANKSDHAWLLCICVHANDCKQKMLLNVRIADIVFPLCHSWRCQHAATLSILAWLNSAIFTKSGLCCTIRMFGLLAFRYCLPLKHFSTHFFVCLFWCSIIKDVDLLKILDLPVLVVLDEAYIEFSGLDSKMAWVKKYENLIVLRTFSKRAGMVQSFTNCIRKWPSVHVS